MLSDEERKAFESVKDMFSDVTIKDIDEQRITIYGIAMLDVIKVLTIVEKQSKEIEELKDIAETLRKENVNLYIERRKNENKIKAKIEELNDIDSEFSQRVIKGKEVYLTEMVQNILKEFIEE